MATNEPRTPELILYIVIEPTEEGGKTQWIRFGAAWPARKGYSVKLEPMMQLLPPFNTPGVGFAMMPYESKEDRENNTRSNDRSRSGGRR